MAADRGWLASVARAEGLSAEEALECVQDALCTYLGRAPESGEQERATVATIVRNAARNARRKHGRAKTHLPIEDAGDALPSLPSTDSAVDLLAHAEDVVRLRACVAELCSVQRAVVTLRLLDERSGEDVAAELGLSRAYVDVLVHRAKGALRVCMRVHGGA